jgi:homocysteine S-methyltransferase
MLPTTPDPRVPLPAPGQDFLTDAGLETELVFKEGVELPHFSAAVLLETPEGRARLRRYYQSFVDLARDSGRGVVLETATWRINPDWAERLGYDAVARSRINHRAVGLLRDLRLAAGLPADRFVISGNLGPRFDGYDGTQKMAAAEARAYHQTQVDTLAEAGADAVTALTLTTAAEAAGIAQSCARREIPCVLSFTVETDGALPSGEALADAIGQVEREAPDAVAYFGINCAHPTHFIDTLRAGGPWTKRIGMIRANASRKSHAELDESTALDEGDPEDLAAKYVELQALLPNLRVLGGCCGTDLRHVARIVACCNEARAVAR